MKLISKSFALIPGIELKKKTVVENNWIDFLFEAYEKLIYNGHLIFYYVFLQLLESTY